MLELSECRRTRHTMSTGTIRAAFDFDDAIPMCWKYQVTSDCAKARAENTICRKQQNVYHNKKRGGGGEGFRERVKSLFQMR